MFISAEFLSLLLCIAFTAIPAFGCAVRATANVLNVLPVPSYPQCMLLGLLIFAVNGGIIGNMVFLMKMAQWNPPELLGLFLLSCLFGYYFSTAGVYSLVLKRPFWTGLMFCNLFAVFGGAILAVFLGIFGCCGWPIL